MRRAAVKVPKHRTQKQKSRGMVLAEKGVAGASVVALWAEGGAGGAGRQRDVWAAREVVIDWQQKVVEGSEEMMTAGKLSQSVALSSRVLARQCAGG